MVLSEFRSDVLSLGDQEMLDRYYYSGGAAVLMESQTAELRRTIAAHHEVPMRDVILVGSAKLGFTVTTKKDRPIFSEFGNDSDIDVAIVSERLYERYWRIAYRYWAETGDWSRVERFRKYMFRGWFRPDLLPAGEDYPEQKAWWDFLLSLQASGTFGPYKIRVGVYHDEFFWESYASSAFDRCRRALEEPL